MEINKLKALFYLDEMKILIKALPISRLLIIPKTLVSTTSELNLQDAKKAGRSW